MAVSPKVRLFSAKLGSPILGVQPAIYQETCDYVTFIVHNSWKLNVNLSLASFESHVAGSRALIDLALASPSETPPTILFTTSIGALSSPLPPSTEQSSKTPEKHFDLECSIDAGEYGQARP